MMVQRTNKFGEVVEEEEGYTLNVKLFGSPLLVIFLQFNRDLINRLVSLPKVFYCESGHIESFINHCYHIIVYSSDAGKIRQWESKLSCRVVAIDLQGNYRDSLPDSIFKLNFKDKSDNFIFEYLKEFLRVGNKV